MKRWLMWMVAGIVLSTASVMAQGPGAPARQGGPAAGATLQQQCPFGGPQRLRSGWQGNTAGQFQGRYQTRQGMGQGQQLQQRYQTRQGMGQGQQLQQRYQTRQQYRVNGQGRGMGQGRQGVCPYGNAGRSGRGGRNR